MYLASFSKQQLNLNRTDRRYDVNRMITIKKIYMLRMNHNFCIHLNDSLMHSDNFFYIHCFGGKWTSKSWNRQTMTIRCERLMFVFFCPWFTSCRSKLGRHFASKLWHNLLVRYFCMGGKKNCLCKRAPKSLAGSSRKLPDRCMSSSSTFAVRCAVDAAHPPVKVLLADGLHQGRVRPVEQVLLIHSFASVPLLHLLSLPNMTNKTWSFSLFSKVSFWKNVTKKWPLTFNLDHVTLSN